MFAVFLTRKRLRPVCCAAAAMLVGGVLLVGSRFGGGPLALVLGHNSLGLKNADQNATRVEFLTGLGWQVSSEPVEVEDVVIPLEFDQVYQNYNAIQLEQGFDLTAYAGRQVTRYSYELLNHPSGQNDVRVNLLVCGQRLIGGDICSLRLDGFMHGLRPPEQSTNAA